jgi:tetratricopeptide (TPR) repeat protein
VIRTFPIALLLVTCAAAAVCAQENPPGPPPQDSSFFQAMAMRALSEKVDLLLDQKRTDLAVQELRRVYTFDVPKAQPSYEMKVRLIGRLAELYAATGKKADALETAKGMLADVAPGTPAEAAAWLEAGTVYRAVGMPDEALKAFDRAIELSNKLAQTGWRPPRRAGVPGPREGVPDRRPRIGPPGEGPFEPSPPHEP